MWVYWSHRGVEKYNFSSDTALYLSSDTALYCKPLFPSKSNNNWWWYLAHPIQKLFSNPIFLSRYNFSLNNYFIWTIFWQALTTTKHNSKHFNLPSSSSFPMLRLFSRHKLLMTFNYLLNNTLLRHVLKHVIFYLILIARKKKKNKVCLEIMKTNKKKWKITILNLL